MGSVPAYGTPEYYIYQAVKEQQKQKPATSGSKPVISWGDSEVKMPDTSKYFEMAAETFNKNKASYDAMFPTRKPATPSTSSTSSSSSSEVKNAEKPKAEGNVDLVKFEYTAEQEGQIKAELKIIESELENLEKNAPKLEGDKAKYREDAGAYHATKTIYEDAKKAFGFMTTIQKGKEKSPAELERILTKYDKHKEALERYFDLADDVKDGKYDEKRFGALIRPTVDIIPDGYKELENACNNTSANNTSANNTSANNTSANSKPVKDSTGSEGSKGSTGSEGSKGSTGSPAQTRKDVLEKLKQEAENKKVIKDFSSRNKSLPSLMFDNEALAKEEKFIVGLLKQFGDRESITCDGGTLEKRDVEAYKADINRIQVFAKQEVVTQPTEILNKLEAVGDKDEDKLKILEGLEDKEVLMLLKDYSQEVVRNFFPKDNIGDDTASYTYLLTRMTAISERFGVDVPSNLSSLKNSKYSKNSQTTMEYEDKKYKDDLPYSVKEGSGKDDKQIVWMKTIDNLTAKFKTEKEIKATEQRTNDQKLKVFEFYVDRIKNVGKNNPDAMNIIKESEERLEKIAINKGDGQYFYARSQSSIKIAEIEKKKNKIKYTLTDASIEELLKPYQNDNGAFKEGQSCDRINDGLSLEEAIALVAENHKFINEMVSDWGVSSTDELGIVYNRVRNNLRKLGYEGDLPQEYNDKGDEEYQHGQFGELKRILKDIGCIPEKY